MDQPLTLTQELTAGLLRSKHDSQSAAAGSAPVTWSAQSRTPRASHASCLLSFSHSNLPFHPAVAQRGRLAVKKPLVIAIVSILLLGVIGVVVFLRPPSLQSSARRAWKEKNIADVSARVADPAWPTNEFARLKLQSTNDVSDDASWLSEHIILTRKGEWLAYANSCQKQDGRIPDIFLTRGSDGHWYYSTYHFCIGMVVLRMDELPEDLVAFAKTYFLQTFDGQSDDCLQKTWPPRSR